MVDASGVIANSGTLFIYDTSAPSLKMFKEKGKYYIVEFMPSELRVEALHLQNDTELKTLLHTINIVTQYLKTNHDSYEDLQSPDSDTIIYSYGTGINKFEIFLTATNENDNKYVIKNGHNKKMYLRDDNAIIQLDRCLGKVILEKKIPTLNAVPKTMDRFSDLDYCEV